MTTLADLISQETQATIYARLLSFAVTAGLDTTSWEEGDPERTLLGAVAYEVAALEQIAARYVASKFLDLAAALTDTVWLKLAAEQQYDYTAREATYATCTVRLTNTSGNVYTIAANDLVFALYGDSSVTYHNTSGGSLNPSSTLDVDVECDVAGSTGSAAIGDIDLVTNVLGVTASNTDAAVGVDEESASSIVAGCRNKLESLSPNGARGAYAYVALNSTITGAADLTRCRVEGSASTGVVNVYLASSSGAPSSADVTLAEEAIVEYCTPQCVTPLVSGASAYPVNVSYSARIYDTVGASTSEIEDTIEDALASMFAAMPIGGDGDDGKVYLEKLRTTIANAYPGYIYDVSLSVPSSDLDLDDDEVATLDVVTASVTQESAP